MSVVNLFGTKRYGTQRYGHNVMDTHIARTADIAKKSKNMRMEKHVARSAEDRQR